MRNIITRAEQRRTMNREYFKGRNICKISDRRIFEFMEKFSIDRRISESIIGSFHKAEDPEKEFIEKTKEGEWKITENKTVTCFIVTNTDHWQCDCGKINTTGLPCSHIIKVFIQSKIDLNFCKELISKRWLLNENKFTECRIIEKDEISFINLNADHGSRSKKEMFLDITECIYCSSIV